MSDGPLAALSKIERRRVLDESAVAIVAPLTGWATLLYLSFGIAHLYVLPASQADILTPLAFATSCVFGAFYLAQRKRTVRPAWANPIIVLAASLALLNSAVHILVQDAPLQATNLMLTVIATSLLCLSTWGLALIVALAIASYGAAVLVSTNPSSAWMHMGFALLTTVGTAAVLLLHRQRATLRLEIAKREIERNEARLSLSLADTRAELTQRERAERELRELSQELEVRVERRAQELAESRAQLALESQERRAAQDALSKQREELERARRLETVGLLAGGIAHDFNNTLTVVLACAELTARKVPSTAPLMAEIEKAAGQASRLTRQLLAFGRRQFLEPRPTLLNEVLRQAEPLLARMLGGHFELRLMLDPELGFSEIDEGQMQQVFANLTINARDAMPEGGILTIATRNLTIADNDPGSLAAGRYVCCTVSDNGVGMSEQVRARIFEPFFTTKNHLGTGLGLSSVHGIIKQSLGDIRVESRLGAGTTFTILLPVTRGLPKALASRPSQGTINAVSGTVLLVEDNAVVRELMGQSLESAGFHVIAAQDGREALSRIEAGDQHVDIVVSDVQMPQMSGTELFEHLEKRFPALCLLLMSAYAPEQLPLTKALSRTAFLQKPFPPSVLVERARTLLASKRYEAQAQQVDAS